MTRPTPSKGPVGRAELPDAVHIQRVISEAGAAIPRQHHDHLPSFGCTRTRGSLPEDHYIPLDVITAMPILDIPTLPEEADLLEALRAKLAPHVSSGTSRYPPPMLSWLRGVSQALFRRLETLFACGSAHCNAVVVGPRGSGVSTVVAHAVSLLCRTYNHSDGGSYLLPSPHSSLLEVGRPEKRRRRLPEDDGHDDDGHDDDEDERQHQQLVSMISRGPRVGVVRMHGRTLVTGGDNVLYKEMCRQICTQWGLPYYSRKSVNDNLGFLEVLFVSLRSADKVLVIILEDLEEFSVQGSQSLLKSHFLYNLLDMASHSRAVRAAFIGTTSPTQTNNLFEKRIQSRLLDRPFYVRLPLTHEKKEVLLLPSSSSLPLDHLSPSLFLPS